MSLMDPKPDLVAAIVRDAGGEIVGWYRLQRTAYFLEVAGLGCGFRFVYRGGGLHSPSLDDSAMVGAYLGKLKETERETDWGLILGRIELARQALRPRFKGDKSHRKSLGFPRIRREYAFLDLSSSQPYNPHSKREFS